MDKYKANYIDLVRFVAIYAVVLGHFHPFVSETDRIGRQLIYLFHMPIFFMVSGMLSKPSTIKKLAYSLLIPYLLYNAISIVQLDFIPIITLDGLNLTNSPTWFFPVLFVVKIVADKIGGHYPPQTVCGVLLVVVTILHYMGVDLPRFLCVNALVYGFLFFMMGRLVYEHIGTLFGAKTQCAIYIATLATDLYVCLNYDRFDMYLADTYNPIVYFVSSLLTNVSVLLICKQAFGMIPSDAHDFIKTISRGTMLIVGTHYVLLKVLDRLLPTGCVVPFGLKMVITIAIVAVYFVVIRYTFNRIPMLYGKRS